MAIFPVLYKISLYLISFIHNSSYLLIPYHYIAPSPFPLPTGNQCFVLWFCFIIFICLFTWFLVLILVTVSHHTWIVVLLLWAYFLLLPSLNHIVPAIVMPHKISHPHILRVLPLNDLNHQKKTQKFCHMGLRLIFPIPHFSLFT